MRIHDFLEVLKSDEYQCPGGHFNRQLTNEEEDADVLLEGVSFVESGECEEIITITLDWEGDEFGGSRYYYPVAEGPCVPILHMEDEPFYDTTLMGAFQERRSLLAKFMQVQVDIKPVDPRLGAGEELYKAVALTSLMNNSRVGAALEFYSSVRKEERGGTVSGRP